MKRKLTNGQKEFLLEYFFANGSYCGWRNIAEKLLDNGSCVVAGKTCIWHGGIGNFIMTCKGDNLVDCLRYDFDLERFLKSNYYIDIHSQYVKIMGEKLQKLTNEFNEINNL